MDRRQILAGAMGLCALPFTKLIPINTYGQVGWSGPTSEGIELEFIIGHFKKAISDNIVVVDPEAAPTESCYPFSSRLIKSMDDVAHNPEYYYTQHSLKERNIPFNIHTIYVPTTCKLPIPNSEKTAYTRSEFNYDHVLYIYKHPLMNHPRIYETWEEMGCVFSDKSKEKTNVSGYHPSFALGVGNSASSFPGDVLLGIY
jgi:hypothetical protein